MHNQSRVIVSQPLQGSLLESTFQPGDQSAPTPQRVGQEFPIVTMKDSGTLLRFSFRISQVAFTQMGLA